MVTNTRFVSTRLEVTNVNAKMDLSETFPLAKVGIRKVRFYDGRCCFDVVHYTVSKWLLFHDHALKASHVPFTRRNHNFVPPKSFSSASPLICVFAG